MSPHVSDSLRRLVIDRAENRCEYCRLAQEGQEATFHVDHVYPRKHGGESVPKNLALACVSCSLRKSARLTAPDPASGEEVKLFNPRRDGWSEHFEWNGVHLMGRTEVGRATIHALDLNRPLVLALREEAALLGRHP